MQDTLRSTKRQSAREPLRRANGPVGGVLAGLGQTVGVDANLLRLATALAAFVAGPLVLIAYLAAWMFVPVDERLSASERPASAPKLLLYVVGAIVAVQVVLGLVTSLPIGWMIVAGVAVYWFFIRD